MSDEDYPPFVSVHWWIVAAGDIWEQDRETSLITNYYWLLCTTFLVINSTSNFFVRDNTCSTGGV